MVRSILFSYLIVFSFFHLTAQSREAGKKLHRLKYNNTLIVDLGVAWANPLPMDYDGDGDWDLVVSCADVPYNGTYFFENPDGNTTWPVFKPGVRIGEGFHNTQVSFVNGNTHVLGPGVAYRDFSAQQYNNAVELNTNKDFHPGKIRANQWKYCDYDVDLLVNSALNVNYLENIGEEEGRILFEDRGPMGARGLAGHTTSPTVVDWDKDGKWELLTGAEDGFFYYLK